jgi:hypothetical protein
MLNTTEKSHHLAPYSINTLKIEVRHSNPGERRKIVEFVKSLLHFTPDQCKELGAYLTKHPRLKDKLAKAYITAKISGHDNFSC